MSSTPDFPAAAPGAERARPRPLPARRRWCRRRRADTLTGGFVTAARTAGATAAPARLRWAARDLHSRWCAPARRYHDAAHLADVLHHIDRYGAEAPRPASVALAAWFHDAVYDPRAVGDGNERASAALADARLSALGVPADTVDEVVRLVLLTAGHAPGPSDSAGALLCDADLAVLAWPPRDYDRYAGAIRREYAHVPEAAYRAGRAAVLRKLAALPRLYQRRTAWERPARANLRRELASLGATPGHGRVGVASPGR